MSCPHERNSLVHACSPSGWVNVSAGSRAGSAPGGPSSARSALAALQGFQVVMTIDDCDEQVDPTIRRDLDSLAQPGSTHAGLTIIQVERTDGEHQPVGVAGVVSGHRSGAADAFSGGEISRDEARTGGKLGTNLHTARDHGLHALSLGVPRRTGAACVTSV